jgi:hypothetical protein
MSYDEQKHSYSVNKWTESVQEEYIKFISKPYFLLITKLFKNGRSSLTYLGNYFLKIIL